MSQVQTLNEAVYISYNANTFGKGMYSIILSATMGEL